MSWDQATCISLVHIWQTYIWAFSKLCKIMRLPMLILCAKKCLVTITLLCTHGPTTGPTHRFKDCRTTNTQPLWERFYWRKMVGGVEWSKTFEINVFMANIWSLFFCSYYFTQSRCRQYWFINVFQWCLSSDQELKIWSEERCASSRNLK